MSFHSIRCFMVLEFTIRYRGYTVWEYKYISIGFRVMLIFGVYKIWD